MRGNTTLIVAAATVLFLIILILGSRSASVGSIWASGIDSGKFVGHYPYVKPTPLPWNPPSPNQLSEGAAAPQSTAQSVPDRIIIKVKLEHEDASWIRKDFPDWQHKIISVDDRFAKLHFNSQSVDKGRIASAYLKYVIENYDTLPSTMVFLAPSPSQERLLRNFRRAEGFSARDAIPNLQIPFVQQAGFAKLRCPSTSTCDTILPFREPTNWYRIHEVAIPEAWKGLFNSTDVPEKLAAPCCSDFAVSKTQLQKRSVQEYLRFWEWVNGTTMNDETAGAALEYLWHVVFGKEAVFCPEKEKCECELYGKC